MHTYLFLQWCLKIFLHHLPQQAQISLLFCYLLLLLFKFLILNLFIYFICLNLLNFIPLLWQFFCSFLLKGLVSLHLSLFEVNSTFHCIIKSLLHDHFFIQHTLLFLLQSSLLWFVFLWLFDKFGVIISVLLIKSVLRSSQSVQLILVPCLFNNLLSLQPLQFIYFQLVFKLLKFTSFDLVFLEHICNIVCHTRISRYTICNDGNTGW